MLCSIFFVAEFVLTMLGSLLDSDPKYANQIYNYSDYFLFGFPILIGVIFYYLLYGPLLGWIRNANRNWWLNLLICFSLIFIAELVTIVRNAKKLFPEDEGLAFGYGIKYGIIFGFVGILVYFIFSIIVKRWSRNAHHTPF